jgi:hypothetical protein
MSGEHGDLPVRCHDLLFGVRRSIRYHIRRRRFFERWNLVTNALAVIFGSATIGGVVKGWDALAIAAGATVTFFSAVNLVVGTVRMARLHEDLAKRFVDLEKDLVVAGEYDEQAYRSFCAKRLEAERDEPPVLRVLDSICHNELLRAMGYDRNQFVKIAWYQRLLAQFVDIREHAIAAH